MELQQYKNAYEALSYTQDQKDRLAAAAVRASTLKTIRPKRHLVSKLAAVAACMVCVLTVTAEAAGLPTPVSDILAPIFGGAVAQTEIIDKIGRPVDAGDTDNGVTIQAEAIIGDRYNACIVYTIRRDDGNPLLPEGVDAGDLMLGGFSNSTVPWNDGAHGGGWFIDDVPGDSEVRYIETICSDSPLNKGAVKADFHDLTYFDPDAEAPVPVVEGRWTFRFDLDYEDSAVDLGGGSFRLNDMDFAVSQVLVSPVSVYVEYTVDSEVRWSNGPSGRLPEEDSRQMEIYFDDVQILLTMKDGTVVDMSSIGGSIGPEDGHTHCVKSGIFPQILPLEELASVQVGGLTFQVDAP